MSTASSNATVVYRLCGANGVVARVESNYMGNIGGKDVYSLRLYKTGVSEPLATVTGNNNALIKRLNELDMNAQILGLPNPNNLYIHNPWDAFEKDFDIFANNYRQTKLPNSEGSWITSEDLERLEKFKKTVDPTEGAKPEQPKGTRTEFARWLYEHGRISEVL